MPTGYTCKVQDGTVTELKDFAYACAYAFGAMIAYRDDDQLPDGLPKTVKGFGTSYDEGRLAKFRKELADWRKKSPKARKAMFEKERRNEIDRYKKYISDHEEEAKRYDAMIAKVEAWNPPNMLGELKSFMLQQLKQSKDFDCGGDYYHKEIEKHYNMTYERWQEDYVAHLKYMIQTSEDNIRKEIERQKGRQEWVDALRAEFEGGQKA